MTEEYSNLATVKQQVAEKIKSNIRIKEKLLTAIKDVHTIDDLTNLLDYKVKLKNNSSKELQKVERLRKIQYESLNKKYILPQKRQGRNAIFTEDKNDIVSKFRLAGIIKYRTVSLNVVRDPKNEMKSAMWDTICSTWKQEMTDWINNNDLRISNDEMKANKIKFDFLDNSDHHHSKFSNDMLKSLNNDINSEFQFIKYSNGEITEAAKNIVVIDLSGEP